VYNSKNNILVPDVRISKRERENLNSRR